MGIHDAESLCEGYNRGAARAKGEILVFSHDDVEFLSTDLRSKVESRLGPGLDLIGVAGTTLLIDDMWASAGMPHVCGQVAHPWRGGGWEVGQWGTAARVYTGVQAVDGLWFAATRRLWEASPFDEGTFDGFHLYDLDFSYSAWKAGFRLGVCADIAVIHESEGRFDDVWRGHAEKFRAKHSATLGSARKRVGDVSVVAVRTKAEALEVMTPPHWSAWKAGARR